MKDQDDTQTIDVFEPKKSGRGGFRPGSGRRKLRPTVVMRVPASMADAFKAIIAADEAGVRVEFRIVPIHPEGGQDG